MTKRRGFGQRNPPPRIDLPCRDVVIRCVDVCHTGKNGIGKFCRIRRRIDALDARTYRESTTQVVCRTPGRKRVEVICRSRIVLELEGFVEQVSVRRHQEGLTEETLGKFATPDLSF